MNHSNRPALSNGRATFLLDVYGRVKPFLAQRSIAIDVTQGNDMVLMYKTLGLELVDILPVTRNASLPKSLAVFD
jgi:hypothetical protein